MEKANTMKPLLKRLNSGFSYSVRFWDSHKNESLFKLQSFN